MQMNINNKNKVLLTDHTSIAYAIQSSINYFDWGPIFSELPKESILVGGFIRDKILGKSVDVPDVDIVVPHNSLSIATKIAKKFNGKLIIIDKKRDIARIIFKEFIFDIAPKIKGSLSNDLQSRDFTINSIAFKLDSCTIFDPCGGLNDLKNSYLTSFNYDNLLLDPLRMLRCFRFFALLNFHIDEKLIQFIIRNKNYLQNVSCERINYEIRQIIRGNYALETVVLINSLRLFDWIQTYEKNTNQKKLKSTYSEYLNYQEVDQFLPTFYLSEVIDEFAVEKLKFSKKEITDNKNLMKWKNKLIGNSIEKLNEIERFELHRDLEHILPAFIVALPSDLQKNWLNRWRNPKDKLFHPRNIVNGETLKNCTKIEDGPLLGALLNYLSKEFAYERIENVDEAIFKAKQWIQQNAPKCD